MEETEVFIFRTVFRFLFLCFGGGGTLLSPVAFDAMVVVPGILLRGRGFVAGVVPRGCRRGFLTPCLIDMQSMLWIFSLQM